MNRPAVSHAMEDYLKAIYELAGKGPRVSTSSLAGRMGCTPASVTNMIQKLSTLKLVEYTPYRGVGLTEAGTRIALEVLRHHRLIELYLAQVLGYSWDQVHEEAEELEHVISEEFEARIDEALGFPVRDPHGAPIPTRDGEVETIVLPSLWEAEEGRTLQVVRVDDKSPEVLRYLASLGILPEAELLILRRGPFKGPLFVSIDSAEQSLTEELARQVFVRAL